VRRRAAPGREDLELVQRPHITARVRRTARHRAGR
jgi:hypothetical protein